MGKKLRAEIGAPMSSQMSDLSASPSRVSRRHKWLEQPNKDFYDRNENFNKKWCAKASIQKRSCN